MKSVYKIRNFQTGLFSTGGCYPSWTKTGKTWSRASHVASHLNLVDKSDYNEFCEVVEYQMVEAGSTSIHVKMDAIHMAHHDKMIKRQQRIDEMHKKRRLEEYEKLKKEFGNE